MTEKENKVEIFQDTWAGAAKEFFKQFGSLGALLIMLLFFGQACDIIDIYRLLGK
jgi:hypothetical protein